MLLSANTVRITDIENAGYITDISAFSINNLNDVNLTGVANNTILVWQTNRFVVADNTFIVQTDTPTTYAGAANKLVSVNATATGLEFTDVIDGGTY